jgi:hypothetical protein
MLGALLGLATLGRSQTAPALDRFQQLPPAYAAAEWQVPADAPFVPVRRNMEQLRASVTGVHLGHPVVAKAVVAVEELKAKKGDPVALYRATYLYMIARSIDYSFDPVVDESPRAGFLADAWRTIGAPPSYEFSRLGFAFNGGFVLEADLLPLVDRLWRRDPEDLWIAPAYVGEVFGRGRSEDKARVVPLAKKLIATYPDRPRGHLTLALAYLASAPAQPTSAPLNAAIASIDAYLQAIPGAAPRNAALDWRKSLERRLAKAN